MAPDDDAPAPKLDPRPEPANDDSGVRRAKTIEMPKAADPVKPPEPKPDKDDSIPETIRQRLEHLVPELVKKTFAAGMGAVFQTEEGIRRIARETREFLSNLNLTEELAKLLTTLSFEIKTEIRFIPNSERFTGAEPDVKASVRLKRADKDKDKEKDEPEPKDRDSRPRLRFWRRDDDGDGNDSHDK
jgi:hypothetical protein